MRNFLGQVAIVLIFGGGISAFFIVPHTLWWLVVPATGWLLLVVSLGRMNEGPPPEGSDSPRSAIRTPRPPAKVWGNPSPPDQAMAEYVNYCARMEATKKPQS